jgi:hypothetical protein
VVVKEFYLAAQDQPQSLAARRGQVNLLQSPCGLPARCGPALHCMED